MCEKSTECPNCGQVVGPQNEIACHISNTEVYTAWRCPNCLAEVTLGSRGGATRKRKVEVRLGGM